MVLLDFEGSAACVRHAFSPDMLFVWPACFKPFPWFGASRPFHTGNGTWKLVLGAVVTFPFDFVELLRNAEGLRRRKPVDNRAGLGERGSSWACF